MRQGREEKGKGYCQQRGRGEREQVQKGRHGLGRRSHADPVLEERVEKKGLVVTLLRKSPMPLRKQYSQTLKVCSGCNQWREAVYTINDKASLKSKLAD